MSYRDVIKFLFECRKSSYIALNLLIMNIRIKKIFFSKKIFLYPSLISTGGFIYTLLSDLKLYNQAMIIKTLIPSGDALDVPFVFLGYLLYGNKTSHIVRFGHLSRP